MGKSPRVPLLGSEMWHPNHGLLTCWSSEPMDMGNYWGVSVAGLNFTTWLNVNHCFSTGRVNEVPRFVRRMREGH